MANAKQITKRRVKRTDNSFVELSIYEVPVPLRGSAHNYKYRLAYIVSDICALRYDNEAGKGDHKHIGALELTYRFTDLEMLLRDFFADVERMEQ
jgi:hypothetical protein